MARRNILIGCGAVVVLGVLVFVTLLVGIIGGGSSKQSATSPAAEPGSTVAESQKNSAPKNITPLVTSRSP
jgi:hypothetical protein